MVDAGAGTRGFIQSLDHNKTLATLWQFMQHLPKMGIFSASSPFDQVVEKATSEKNTSEDWGQIMDICDRVKESNVGPRDCLKSIAKRLNSENPRIVLQAVTLLDACINNCGRKFLLEVASRDFEQELRKHLTSTRTHHKVSERLRESLRKWAESEFKGDPQLSLIPALYTKLKQEGYDFNVQSDSPKKVAPKYSTDPNVVNSKQEEDDIARAIQLSLQESGGNGTPSSQQSSRPISNSLYSTATAALNADTDSTIASSSSPAKEHQKARALYDFEAAEDNELTFKAGEIVIVQDSSDPNWWKGTNHRGEGLFPANFVTLDLNVESESARTECGKRVSFSECVEVTEVEGAGSEDILEAAEVTGEIDEEKIDRLLHVLHEADPTGERPDPTELSILEDQVNAMAPTIDAELEQIDRKHALLARISTDLVDALGLYHQLMREMPPAMSGYYPIPKNPVNASGQMPGYAQSPTPSMPPQMYVGPGQFGSYMGPPPPGAPLGPVPFPNMPPSGSAPGPPSQQQMGSMPAPNQALHSQPTHGPSMPGPQPPLGQPIPPPADFQQMPINSHDASGASLMPSYGHFPPTSQYGPLPTAHPGGPLEHSNGPPNTFPIYSQPQTAQQPLL
ncbi:signal transducing adapter molecule 1 isoform X1 [Procambarus clarkii]|uniref:signal transducing adapter molecule 1 isoform X1 n=1 Tax=Procambarus clarkii TaxID=6728 RepID=UPI0037439910